MDYEKEYKEALKRAEIFKKHLLEINDKGYAEEIDYIFPELKESEDERIRKELIEYIKDQQSSFISAPDCRDKYEEKENNKYNSWITWLEKQGESKPIGKLQLSEELYEHIRNTCACIDDALSSETLADINDYLSMAERSAQSAFDMIEKQREKNTADKVEPKFHEGDWVMLNENHNSIYQVEKIENSHYVLRHILGGAIGEPFGLENLMRRWTIKDAKEGDVLVLNGEVFIYAHRKQLYSIAVAHCFVNSVGIFHFDGEFGYTEKGNSIHPATASKRNRLFAIMEEAGYEWDANKKEIHKLHERV